MFIVPTVRMESMEDEMKVLLINGSPNAKGCTYTALTEVSKALHSDGIETEMIQVGDKVMRGCAGCRQCRKIGKCVFDDLVNEVAPRFEASEGIIIGSPVYFASANGTLISFIDRLFYSVPWDKTMKVGAAVVSARRGGASASFDELNKYFTISGMPVVSSQYWNSVHGNTPEEIMSDFEGLQTMSVLGRNMSFLIKSIALGKKTYGLPEKEKHIATNFIR
jgi:multimeric flavodoxin WrbA